jgi:hypothetical protein
MFWLKLLAYIVFALITHFSAAIVGYESRPLIDAWRRARELRPHPFRPLRDVPPAVPAACDR